MLAQVRGKWAVSQKRLKNVYRKAKLTLSTIALIVGILFQCKTFIHRIDIEPPLKVKL